MHVYLESYPKDSTLKSWSPNKKIHRNLLTVTHFTDILNMKSDILLTLMTFIYNSIYYNINYNSKL